MSSTTIHRISLYDMIKGFKSNTQINYIPLANVSPYDASHSTKLRQKCSIISDIVLSVLRAISIDSYEAAIAFHIGGINEPSIVYIKNMSDPVNNFNCIKFLITAEYIILTIKHINGHYIFKHKCCRIDELLSHIGKYSTGTSFIKDVRATFEFNNPRAIDHYW